MLSSPPRGRPADRSSAGRGTVSDEASAAGGRDDVMRTGVPNLDAVLGGGIRRGAIAMVIGAPGTGKTSWPSRSPSAGRGRGERSCT